MFNRTARKTIEESICAFEAERTKCGDAYDIINPMPITGSSNWQKDLLDKLAKIDPIEKLKKLYELQATYNKLQIKHADILNRIINQIIQSDDKEEILALLETGRNFVGIFTFTYDSGRMRVERKILELTRPDLSRHEQEEKLKLALPHYFARYTFKDVRLEALASEIEQNSVAAQCKI